MSDSREENDNAAAQPPKAEAVNDTSLRNTESNDPVFYYSRERRLSQASERVQSLNEGTFTQRSFLKGLFTNNSHRMFLFVIIFALAAFALASRFMGTSSGGSQRHEEMMLAGNLLAITILPVEGMPFLVIAKNAPEHGEFFVGAVDIAVSPVRRRTADGNAEDDVFTQRIFFNLVESETFRISLPFFEEKDFFVMLGSGDEQRTFRIQSVEN